MIEAPQAHDDGAAVGTDGSPAAPSGPIRPVRVASAPRMPVKYVYAIAGLALLMLVVLIVADRLLPTSPADGTNSSEPATLTSPGTHGGQAAPAGARSLHAPLSAVLDLHALGSHAAPPFTLTDAATGRPVSLESLRGHVVVLTFADAACNDVCPVLAAELEEADALLGTTQVPVTFVTVNTDPLDLATGKGAAILGENGVTHLSNWRFLTGTVRKLNAVWTHYEISITVDRTDGKVTHNDAMYFIGPKGTLVWSASAWADETAQGSYTLTGAETARFASGIAHYADELAAAK